MTNKPASGNCLIWFPSFFRTISKQAKQTKMISCSQTYQ